MKITWSKMIFALSLVFTAGLSLAQTPNPMDVIPDAMPFDVPYGTPISLDKAEALINEVIAESKWRNWKMNVAVVDSGGNLVAFKRMDGAQLASIAIAEHKARAAAKFRRDTKLLEDAIQKFAYIGTLDDVIASRGGIPLVVDGKIVGAVGWALITTLADETEVQPEELVTINEYVPAARPAIVALVPVPVVMVPPGVTFNDQVPVEGKLFKTTLPVANAQDGWVIVPTVGVVVVQDDTA